VFALELQSGCSGRQPGDLPGAHPGTWPATNLQPASVAQRSKHGGAWLPLMDPSSRRAMGALPQLHLPPQPAEPRAASTSAPTNWGGMRAAAGLRVAPKGPERRGTRRAALGGQRSAHELLGLSTGEMNNARHHFAKQAAEPC